MGGAARRSRGRRTALWLAAAVAGLVFGSARGNVLGLAAGAAVPRPAMCRGVAATEERGDHRVRTESVLLVDRRYRTEDYSDAGGRAKRTNASRKGQTVGTLSDWILPQWGSKRFDQ